jgi:type IX secretion system PorP/SprF family membrane protein
MNTAINEKKIGLGLYYFRDEIAPIVSQGLMATYAYRIRLEKGWFSMGLQGGLKSLNYDWAIIRTKYPDYLFYPQEIQKYTPDFNLGLYYQSQNFFAGLSSKHLLENEIAVGEVDGKSTFSKLARHFYFMTGFALPINDKMAFRPSMLTKYTRNSPVQFDFNASIVFNNIFWVGMSYRTVSALTFMTEFTMLKNLRLGYSFDLYVNDLQLHNKGSHEIRLAYDFARNSRMKTPRYF